MSDLVKKLRNPGILYPTYTDMHILTEEAADRIKYLEGVILAASDEYEEDRGYVVIEREARLIREARDE